MFKLVRLSKFFATSLFSTKLFWWSKKIIFKFPAKF